MKTTIFVLFCGIGTLFAGETYSQSTKISLNMKDASIESVLNKIEEVSEYYFLFNQKLIDVERKVDVIAEEKPIGNILSEILSDNVKVIVSDRQIVLTPVLGSKDLEDAFIQPQSVTGKVTDASNGEAMPGVNIQVKGMSVGTITDVQGGYSIPITEKNSVLVFSFIGYITQEITVTGRTTLDITLAPETVGLDEVVVVGYGTQRKGNLTGSVASVRAADIVKAPVSTPANSLAGRLSGLISRQTVGTPGSDAASLSIRGFGSALVLVDGVEGNFDSLDPSMIESVSILKDGSASIYGARAGNGVILVTTKRGLIQKPTITYQYSYTMQGITQMPKLASAGQYAEMKREYYLNNGYAEEYTLEEIQKYYEGTDPQYPNTDWEKVLLRRYAPENQHNIAVRGGSDRFKYQTFLGYVDQETLWKNNGGNYKKYNVQSNIDAKILDNLSFQFDLASTITIRNFPWRPTTEGADTNWQDYWYTTAVYPATLPDPDKVPYSGGNVNAFCNMDLIGYDKRNSQNLRGTMALKYDINAIKGLSAKLFANYSQNFNTQKNFQKPVEFYTYDYASDIYNMVYTLTNNGLGISKDQDRTITGQFSLNYDNTLGQDHHLSCLALFEVIDYYRDNVSASRKNFLTYSIDQMYAGSTTGMTNSGSAYETGRESVIGRLNYSFRNKYLFESTIRLDASAKFPEEKRWGFFPSISIGWRLSEENFMKQQQVFDDLKLRANYGSSGNDGVGNFAYLSGYGISSGTYLIGNTNYPTIYSTGLANPNLTWEKIKIYNIGIDFSMWKRKLFGSMEAFYRERTGIPGSRITSLPPTFGATLPTENLNSINNRGFETELGTSLNIQKVRWIINGNISWSRAKWMHYEEPLYTDPDQDRIYRVSDRWTDIRFGYISDGLFKSQDEINTLGYDMDQKGNTTLHPGDIKYLDTNDDKVVDWKDMAIIGKGTNPHWMLGLNSDLQYKNFDLSALFQGAMGFYNYVKIPSTYNAKVIYDLRWTEENNDPNTFIPRLGSTPSNSWTSDHWYKKANYLRLKTLSLGYNIPESLLNSYKITQFRIYVAGTNLLTFSGLNKFNIDPETSSGDVSYGQYYPQARTISFGISLSL